MPAHPMLRFSLLLVSLLTITACGDDNRICVNEKEELRDMLRNAGTPGLDKPAVSYTKSHHDMVKKIIDEGCTLESGWLGQAPMFCNNGLPACPDKYTCGASKVCAPL